MGLKRARRLRSGRDLALCLSLGWRVRPIDGIRPVGVEYRSTCTYNPAQRSKLQSMSKADCTRVVLHRGSHPTADPVGRRDLIF